MPILVLSMHNEDIYAVRTLRAGASGYLCKDNAETQLAQAIRKVAKGGLFINAGGGGETGGRDAARPTADAPPHTLLSDREYQIFQSSSAARASRTSRANSI